MTVQELIYQLDKVERKEATVYAIHSELISNEVTKAVIEHDLEDDEVVVVLKTNL